ncbi:MAG: hypothetical protein HYZ71_08790 [Deltaproteobacteria bacterium]|nr:hypothetical protein [Deltaproteobacteria bacterium]
MRLISTFLLLFSTNLFAAMPLEDSKVTTDDGIQVFLTNERGEPQTTFYFAPGQRTAEEVVFRHSVSAKRGAYSSWVLEITEPKEGLSYRMAFEGSLPFLIHWDGMFDNERGIVPNRKYFLRLLLVTKEKEVFSSPFAFFSSAEREVESGSHGEKVQIEVAKLFVNLTGGFHVVSAQTPKYSTTLFPNIDGDLGIYWKEMHRFGVRFDVTSSIFSGWNYDAGGNELRYSDLSLSYRWRVAGAPPRRPQLPYTPPYVRGAGGTNYEPSLFGAPFNLELGVKVFNTVVAGSADQAINNEVPGQIQGLALTLNSDMAVSVMRAYLNIEAGSSLFNGGQMNIIGIGGMLVYDRWESIAPGLVFHYMRVSGAPDQTLLPGVNSISNSLIFAGASLVFKVS